MKKDLKELIEKKDELNKLATEGEIKSLKDELEWRKIAFGTPLDIKGTNKKLEDRQKYIASKINILSKKLQEKIVPQKMKKRYKYMHTINGRPACFCENQICYAGKWVDSLCDSLKQIRKEQEISTEYRSNLDWTVPKYGYVKVIIE